MARISYGETIWSRVASTLAVAGAAAAVAALSQASSVQLQYSGLPLAVRGVAVCSVLLLFLLSLGLAAGWPASRARATWWPRLVAAAMGAGVASTLLVYPHLFVRGGNHYHPSGILGDLAARVALMGGLALLAKAAVTAISQRSKRFQRFALMVVGCAMFCEACYLVVPSWCDNRFDKLYGRGEVGKATRYIGIAATLQPTERRKLNYALALCCRDAGADRIKARRLLAGLDWSGPGPMPALAYNLTAKSEADAGNLQNARDCVQAGLHKYPDDPELWALLGYVEGLQRRWSGAITALDNALRLFRRGSFPPREIRDAEQQRLVAIRYLHEATKKPRQQTNQSSPGQADRLRLVPGAAGGPVHVQ